MASTKRAGQNPATARLVAEARELRALGLDAAAVGEIVRRSPGWVYRHTGGVRFTGLPDDAGRLTTPRARAVYAAMMRQRRANRDLALARVEERVARILERTG